MILTEIISVCCAILREGSNCEYCAKNRKTTGNSPYKKQNIDKRHFVAKIFTFKKLLHEIADIKNRELLENFHSLSLFSNCDSTFTSFTSLSKTS